jgi:hypothetical protein
MSPDRAVTLLPNAQQALKILREAHAAAALLKMPAWEFALSIASLNRLGIGETVIRLLLAAGLAESRVERITLGTRRRTLLPIANLALPENARVIVTQAGLDFEGQQPAHAARIDAAHREQFAPVADLSAEPPTPFWDRKDTLWWGKQVIKRLRRNAKPQRHLLKALQEMNWPHCLLDPLPPNGRSDAKARLRYMVRHLNEHHQIHVIRFWVDEEGTGICWERI